MAGRSEGVVVAGAVAKVVLAVSLVNTVIGGVIVAALKLL